MDDLARFNKERWEELSREGISFSVPWLDLTKETALARVNPEQIEAPVVGREVLCLAASGGQQSAAFGLLGAKVTVFDLSETQLAKDTEMARHYGHVLRTVQGDMRDLSVFADSSFDGIWLAHSINFIPDARKVLSEISRLSRPGGWVRLEFTNPNAHGVWDNWKEDGYIVRQAFIDGGEVLSDDDGWTFTAPDGKAKKIRGPREFRHSLTTIINSLISGGFRILGLWEDTRHIPDPEPGSWQHFKSRLPPWITVWARKESGAGQG